MENEKELPGGWTSVKLEDICDIRTGKHDANHSVEGGKYRFYTCAYEYLRCDTVSFKGECLILPGNGANVGQVFYYHGEFDVYQRTYVVENIRVLPKYLFYHMLSNWKAVNTDKQYGSATNYIRIGNFQDYTVNVSSLPEQHRIVAKIEELLSELDKGVESLKTAQQQLKVYRQAVLKWAFEGKLTGIEIKDKKTIQSVARVVTGATPLRSNSSYYNGNIAWITSSSLNEAYVKYEDEFITEKALKETNAKIFPIHTLLMAMYGEGKTRGKCSELLIEAATNQAIAAIILENENIVLRRYLKWYLVKNYNDIRKESSGGVQPNLNLKKVRDILFPYCSIAEQVRIVQEIESRLSVCDKMEEAIEQSLKKAEALRQSILKKAFEGRLVPQNPDDEPAEKLLERIRAEEETHRPESSITNRRTRK